MKFELAFEALRHGYCITVQENKALWYTWSQPLECIRSYIHNMHQCYSLDIPVDRIMTDRWQVGIFIEGNSPIWLDTENCFDIEQVMQYAEIAMEEREQKIGRHSMTGIEALQALREEKKLDKYTWDEWKTLGYHVIKGQMADSFDAEGKALFTSLQVAVTLPKKKVLRNSWAITNPYRGSYDFDGRSDHGGIGEDESCLVNGDWD